jgi:chromosome segregation ATPase
MSEETTQNLPNNDLRLILVRLDSINTRLDRMDERLDRIDERLDNMDGRLDNMDGRLEKLEARAYDTKPIWERALAEIIEIGKRLESLDRRFSVLTDDVIHTRADVRRLGDRIADLEQPSRT